MCNEKDMITRPRVTYRVKKLRNVKQLSSTGCFIGAFATCLGVTYEKAFQIVFPFREMDPYSNHGLHPLHAFELASRHLRGFREAKERHFTSFKGNALVTIRWNLQPSVSHSVVWDFKRQRIIDPLPPSKRHSFHNLDSQIYMAHYFKRPIVQ